MEEDILKRYRAANREFNRAIHEEKLKGEEDPWRLTKIVNSFEHNNSALILAHARWNKSYFDEGSYSCPPQRIDISEDSFSIDFFTEKEDYFLRAKLIGTCNTKGYLHETEHYNTVLKSLYKNLSDQKNIETLEELFSLKKIVDIEHKHRYFSPELSLLPYIKIIPKQNIVGNFCSTKTKIGELRRLNRILKPALIEIGECDKVEDKLKEVQQEIQNLKETQKRFAIFGRNRKWDKKFTKKEIEWICQVGNFVTEPLKKIVNRIDDVEVKKSYSLLCLLPSEWEKIYLKKETTTELYNSFDLAYKRKNSKSKFSPKSDFFKIPKPSRYNTISDVITSAKQYVSKTEWDDAKEEILRAWKKSKKLETLEQEIAKYVSPKIKKAVIKTLSSSYDSWKKSLKMWKIR